VTTDWKSQLEQILRAHATHSPIGSARNFQIIEGDVRQTLPQWLEKNPEALVSHAHFDMDVYEPTRDALKLVLPRMPIPGETKAVQEVLGIHRLALRKSKFRPYAAYCIIE